MTAAQALAALGRRSRPRPPTLPERVRAAIAETQAQGEIMVGWFQLGLFLVFSTLYAVSPKTFDASMTFAPVPWALGLYGAFTAIRLWLAIRHRLPEWFVALSVVVDMALLLGLIWSFHLQYRQPAAFYLKAPTLLYIFIFIALRALRFDTRYVILSGAVGALGWLGLVIYAATDPQGMPATRDYVHYMTSASILWGAEIDKMISIVLVTALLAVALARARRVLEIATSEGAAARDLKRFFAPEIAQRIVGAETEVRPGEGELRDAATLFVDLRGFTPLARTMSPDELVGFLTEYQARIVPCIRDAGGRVDKFLGDGIMASFGAVQPSTTYAADALRAVEAVLDEAAAWMEERHARGLAVAGVGAAVAVGPVVFGAVGDSARLEYTVIGDAVNLAAKLEKHTKAERVRALTAAGDYRLACDQGYAPRHPIEIRAACAVAGVDQALDLAVLG